ncbi:MAG TPA: hypothetical protein VHV08_09580 [Pirellulales bacterium]|nr:hypothetical protein [Pirellulales bacterium]
MSQPFRFIHSSDWHLDRPVRGLAEVPDHLRTALVEAPYRAAERVFDACVHERVDFLVLAGDVLEPLAAGPRGLLFLIEHFEKLGDLGIKVYWAGGRSDNFDRWPDVPLPENVVRFPLGRILRIEHRRHGEPLLQILGTSAAGRKKIRAADFHTDATGLFALAVGYGGIEPEAVASHLANFWALGGEHQRGNFVVGPVTVHYCGTPQGRRPQESGPHGCTLVHVDEALAIRSNFIPTDAVRFHNERVAVAAETTADQLHQQLEERIGELLSDPFGPDWFIQWTMADSRAPESESAHSKAALDLLARLRAEHGAKRPAAWTVSIEHEASHPGRSRYEEDTVLGEFLRTVRHYVEHPEATLEVDDYLTPNQIASGLRQDMAIDEAATRNRVLAEVARLGVRLLSPEDARS